MGVELPGERKTRRYRNPRWLGRKTWERARRIAGAEQERRLLQDVVPSQVAAAAQLGAQKQANAVSFFEAALRKAKESTA